MSNARTAKTAPAINNPRKRIPNISHRMPHNTVSAMAKTSPNFRSLIDFSGGAPTLEFFLLSVFLTRRSRAFAGCNAQPAICLGISKKPSILYAEICREANSLLLGGVVASYAAEALPRAPFRRFPDKLGQVGVLLLPLARRVLQPGNRCDFVAPIDLFFAGLRECQFKT